MMGNISRESYFAQIRNMPFDQLLASVIHDVQNRNQTIMAASSLLKEDIENAAPQETGKYIELITDSTHEISAMLRACDDYLKARHESNKG
jgi:light-regulated signal transduction histidine kinase (bacteriophytochrome)